MQITCCGVVHSIKNPETFDAFEKYSIKGGNLTKGLKAWHELDNAVRKDYGKKPRELEYFTQRNGKKFDYVEVMHFTCIKNHCLKFEITYYKKGGFGKRTVDKQILKGLDADTFDIAMDKFWCKMKLKSPVQNVKNYKRNPGTYPKATGPETGGRKYLIESLGWESKKAYESEVAIVSGYL